MAVSRAVAAYIGSFVKTGLAWLASGRSRLENSAVAKSCVLPTDVMAPLTCSRKAVIGERRMVLFVGSGGGIGRLTFGSVGSISRSLSMDYEFSFRI